jgi:response regulator NasT
MFATDGAPETIRRAVRAGVSAYIVDGLDPARVKSIVASAIATFEEFQRLRQQLAERKHVDRAKAILMKKHGFDEETAYAMLRKRAMERNLRIGEVAQRIIDGA